MSKQVKRVVLKGKGLEVAEQIKARLGLTNLTDAVSVMAQRYEAPGAEVADDPPSEPQPESAVSDEAPGPMKF